MDSKEIEKRRLTLDDLAHRDDETGVEFWYAREIMPVFGYTQWRRFEDAVSRAMASVEASKTPDEHHFAEVGKMVSIGSRSKREVKDYMLTRYACYLIAMNGDLILSPESHNPDHENIYISTASDHAVHVEHVAYFQSREPF